jgi:transposase InsO family protein
MQERKRHRRYDRQFKEEAIRLVTEGGRPVTEVARLMKIHGIAGKAKKKFKATTNSKHDLPVAENLLSQNFVSEKPNTVWVSDIT